MTSPILSLLMLGAISLDGVSGDRLSARAYFDANNVRLGDPMSLTVEFAGNADFSALHPPALSKEVDRRAWKVDDTSAKTETTNDGRRLLYRVRPLKEGVLEFPALEFAYSGLGGGAKAQSVSTRPVPVHVKPGAQAALAGLDADADGLPMPDGIVVAVASRTLGDDELFRWRKACRAPTAAAFADFDFPEARLNEAACHVVEGNWAKAIRVYSLLEWRTGQTPAIELGITAALARKHSSAAVELPVWRSAFRPVLRFAWLGRLGVLLAAIAAFALLLWLSRRVVRALACAALALGLPLAASAQQPADPFEEMDRRMQQMMQRVNSMMGVPMPGGGGSQIVINGQPVQQRSVEVSVSASATKADAQVGETFEFLFSIECPKDVTIDQLRISPSEMTGMCLLTGSVSQLADAPSSNPSNVVHRYSTEVRYDVPFRGRIYFQFDCNATGTTVLRHGANRSSFSFSRTVSKVADPVEIAIRPLPEDGQPPDFSGAVGTGFALTQSVNRNRVETNDVVVVTSRLSFKGHVPADAFSGDIVDLRPGSIAWRSYFVADGSPSLPDAKVVCYDTDSRTYRTVVAKGTRLSYVADSEAESVAVAVDAGGEKGDGRVLKLRFAPSASAPEVARVPRPDATPAPTEEPRGEWVRVEAGGHAGWVRKEDLR